MKETLEQYLARGGKISRIEPADIQPSKQTVPMSYSGSVYDLYDGALYFAERAVSRKTRDRVKSVEDKRVRMPKLNLSLLPVELLSLIPQAQETTDEEALQSQVLQQRT